MKDIIVLYHGNCLDGFAAAYVAWKKFGESATYIPVHHGDVPPQDLAGREVYIVDFSYTEEILLALEKEVKRLVVLDHHVGAKEAVEKVREHVFDNEHSGVGIAWKYWNNEAPLPRILAYIEHNDLWRHDLAHAKVVATYLSTIPFDFVLFDQLVERGERDELFQEIIVKGTAYREYFNYTCAKLATEARLVHFDDYEVLATSAPRFFRSEVGHLLNKKQPPFAIVYYLHNGSWHFSLRGDGSIDLSEVAKKYGGFGHHNAASFRLPLGSAFPFEFVKTSEGEVGESE